MGKEVRGVPQAASLTPTESIGRYLAGQRRLRGISIDELALRTRIPLRNLERLESGAFDDHDDGFARSFVRTVAVALGLNPDEAVTRLLAEPGVADGEGELRGRLGRHPYFLVAGLAALAIGAGLVLWSWGGGTPPGPPDESPVSEVVTRRDAVRALAAGQADEHTP